MNLTPLMGGTNHRNMYYIWSMTCLSVKRVVVNTIIYKDEHWGAIRLVLYLTLWVAGCLTTHGSLSRCKSDYSTALLTTSHISHVNTHTHTYTNTQAGMHTERGDRQTHPPTRSRCDKIFCMTAVGTERKKRCLGIGSIQSAIGAENIINPIGFKKLLALLHLPQPSQVK